MAVDTIARALALKAEGGNTPPDLSNYVQFSDFATPDKAGVINSGSNGFSVDASGNTSADVYTSEQYGGLGDNSFISKGTLENAKEQYISSSTTVQNIINSENSDLPKQDVVGTDNTFDDGLESPLYDLGGDGKSEQVVTQGYQLVDWENNFSKSTGVSFSFINDILIVNGVSGTAYQSVTYNITDVVKNNPGKTIKYSDYKHSITNNDTNSVAQIAVRYSDETPALYRVVCNYNTNQLSSYVVPSDISNINRVDLSIFTNNSDNTNIDNTITIEKPLLYFDNNNIYEPYTGGQPSPSPDYPQEINSIEGSVEFACRGKNLFDVNNTMNILVDTSIDEEGWITVNTDNSEGTATKFVNIWTHPNYNILPNKSYKLVLEIKSHSGSDGYLAAVSDDQKSPSQFKNQYQYIFRDMVDNSITIYDIVSKESFDKSKNMIRTFIASPVGSTQKLVFRISVIDDDKVAPQNFRYEPYIEPNQVTFNLNDEKLRSVRDVKDELVVDLDTGDYYKVEHIGEEIFDRDTNFKINSPWNQERPEIFHAYTFIDDRKPFSNIIMNYFSNIGSLDTSKEGFFVDSTGKAIYLFIKVSSLSSPTIESLKSWLSEHNTIVNYVLQTPTTKKLGTLSTEDLAKLKTFKGYNNVTVNTNLGLMNIRFTYGLDIKKYVDNKIAQLSEQLIKGE